MVCKFAKICELYRPEGVTCNKQNGGPFDLFTGKAYCGKYNSLIKRDEFFKNAAKYGPQFALEALA